MHDVLSVPTNSTNFYYGINIVTQITKKNGSAL